MRCAPARRIVASFTPSRDTRTYAAAYAEYRKLFGTLKGLYHRLNARPAT